MEIPFDAPAPKRGDLIQTNIGDKRERTWIILRAVRMLRARNRRFKVWKARWWELEPEMRMRLYLSARRRGPQRVWEVRPMKPQKKKKPTFEDHMKRKVVMA